MTPPATAVPSATVDLPPIRLRPSIVGRWLAPGLSAALLAAALWQLRHLELHQVFATVPRTPLFWLTFAAAYLLTPASEWLIYRRLWRLPARGFVALLSKRVSNEIVLGYSGELYFYAWARRHAQLVGAPFGAIKDVSILSAIVANIITLLLVAFCWPTLEQLRLGADHFILIVSAAAVAIPSVVALVLRGKLLTLPRPALWMIARVHCARIIGTAVFTGLLWTEVMPAAPLIWWLLLAVLRLLVSRLPLLPNKDVMFAGLVAFAVGQTATVTAMLTMLAALILATHLLVGAILGASELAREERAA